MKSLFLTAMFVTLIASAVFTQTLKYEAFSAEVINNANDKSVTLEVDIIITVTDYKMTFDSGAKFYFTSDVVHISKTYFYAWATDNDGKNCKVYFKVFDARSTNIGLEYVDLSFVYRTNRIQ